MLPSSQMAIQFMLLLMCSLYSMYSSSSSSSPFSTSSCLALLVLVISTCLSLLFSNLRHLIKTSSHKNSMEEVAHQERSTVPQDQVSEDVPDDSAGSLSGSSDCQVSEEVSASDDDDDDDNESLIEISLVDGHYVGQEEKCPWKKEQDLLADFLPQLVLDKRDFMDILSEISEEENMIEIDIARGSIKCANFSIKA